MALGPRPQTFTALVAARRAARAANGEQNLDARRQQSGVAWSKGAGRLASDVTKGFDRGLALFHRDRRDQPHTVRST
jgi:hypothetical protein